MTEDVDAKLRAMLSVPERAPDDRFVRRIELEILAEQRLEAARRRSRHAFASEALAGGAVVVAFVILARMQPAGPAGFEFDLLSPAMLGLLLLGLWAAAMLPAGVAEGR